MTDLIPLHYALRRANSERTHESKPASIVDTSFFEPIIPLITNMQPADRYMEMRVPEELQLERDQVLAFLEGGESKFSGGRFISLRGTVKDQVVFDYLYQQYNAQLSKPKIPADCNIKLQAHSLPACNPDYQPIMDNIILDHYRQAHGKANRYREEIIFDRLKYLGCNLDLATQEEKEKFAKERLVFIKQDGQHPDWRELYLYPEMTFIASWWETVEFETFTDEKYATMGKITFGNSPKPK